MSYKFFQNKTCEYFPCHKMSEEDQANFNCLFCYCPLYQKADCGGRYTIMKNGCKDCSACTVPHFDYDYVLQKLKSYCTNVV